ncbi:MAG: hypothetical protein LBR15_03200 [Methanobrevibacter sp.]|nr:hypothetical protein [Candidatus Methanovirga australis]
MEVEKISKSRGIKQDKKKLLKIIEELKQDFNEGKISKEKYENLLDSYDTKLKNINATLRLRKMQGLTDDDFHDIGYKSSKLNSKGKYLADDHIVKNDHNPQTVNKPKNNHRYVIIAIVFLIIAFFAGATSGFFNYSHMPDQTGSEQSANSLQINENAFPSIVKDINVNTVKTSEYYPPTDYTNENDDNSDDHDHGSNPDDSKPSVNPDSKDNSQQK